jgi:hypothetical protein
MNWEIEINGVNDIVLIDAAGHATSDECQRMLDDLLSRPFWHSGYRLYIDCRKVSVRALNYDEIDRSGMALQNRRDELGKCRMAILANSGLGYGIGHQFKVLTESKTDIDIEVFVDELEARHWLNLS